MITITIKDSNEYPTSELAGLHVQEPTFIEFLNALSIAIEGGFEQMIVYDTVGQFATMPRWAMAEKIGELTSMPATLRGHDITVKTY